MTPGLGLGLGVGRAFRQDVRDFQGRFSCQKTGFRQNLFFGKTCFFRNLSGWRTRLACSDCRMHYTSYPACACASVAESRRHVRKGMGFVRDDRTRATQLVCDK